MISPEMIKHLAELSKINFTDEELNKMTSDMNGIVTLMDKVRDFDTDIPAQALNPVDYKDLRADEHQSSCPAEEIIKNAKKVTGNSFTVPTIV